MKKRFNKLSALLVLGLLLVGMSLACYVWVRKEQRQYKLNRDLIAALLKNDTKQALVLVEAGADPNTMQEPSPAPSLPSLIKKLLHPAPPQVNDSPTAFLIACGSWFVFPQGIKIVTIAHLSPLDPQLTQAMLLHGANVYTRDEGGKTALQWSVYFALHGPKADYSRNIEIITQLLVNGAAPDEEDNGTIGIYGKSPKQSALVLASNSAPSRPDLIALLRKYRKHP